MEAACAEFLLCRTRQSASKEAVGSSPHCPVCLLPAPSFHSPLFHSIPAVILGKVLGGSRYPYQGTCPLKELGHFVRIFLSYAHFPFLPSTLSLTQISPSPRRHCRSHVVPIFLQENPSNPSKQLQVRLVLEQLWWVRTANSFPGPGTPQLIQPLQLSAGSGLPGDPVPGRSWPGLA